MPSCPSCGKSVADGAAFCGYCGAGTTAPVASDSPGDAVLRSDADYWICGSCHAENLVGDACCQTCGSARSPVRPLVAPPHAAAAAAAVPAAGLDGVAHGPVCTSCGTPNELDASFCHVCGVPLVARTAGYSSQPAWAPPAPTPATSNNARWIVIAAIVVVAAAAVVIGIVLLGGRDGDGGGVTTAAVSTTEGTATDSAGVTSEPTTTSSTPTERDATRYVTSVRSRTCLRSDGSNSYYASNLTDGVNRTCWAEGVSGFGVGESVRFKFAQRMSLTRMEVVPGYDKYTSGWDRWYSNGRLRKITVTFADGSQESFRFSDKNRWQACKFGSPKIGSSLEFTVDDVYRPDADNPHYAQDTSVSEVRFYGWRASEGGQ